MRIDKARELAQEYSKDDSDRWIRLQRVAALAGNLAETIITNPTDGETLVKAAWLHDIGRSPQLAKTGLYSLDGAVFLEENGEHKLALLVANHSFSKEEAALRGLSEEMEQFHYSRDLLSECLTYCDLSIDQRGKRLVLTDRVTDVLEQFGPNSVIAAALSQSLPEIQDIFTTVETLVRQYASL